MISSAWSGWKQAGGTFIRRGRRRFLPGAAADSALERRELLAASGDYVLSGFSWPDATSLTYSIAPDGVFWDHGVNNLNATFDAKFGAGNWERELARALATWESVANVNISITTDALLNQGVSGLAEGDPRFGDVRFGGYGFANDATTLAQTYFPPPGGATRAGDVDINTSMNFGVGANYDLYSVMLHETGHALGLDHVNNPAEVMHPNYQGLRQGLAAGDLAGIQALYGARIPDGFRRAGLGGNFDSAIDLSSIVNGQGEATQSGVSLSKVGDTEYYTVVAPANATGTLRAVAAAFGLSMLSPKITLYDGAGRQLDTDASPAYWSSNIGANATGVTPGQRYYIAVTGATSDAFAVGAYQLQLDFSTSAEATKTTTPAAPAAPTGGSLAATPGIAPDRFESNGTRGTATILGTLNQIYVTGLTLNNGSDTDNFVFQNARAGVLVVTAPGAKIRVTDAYGNTVTTGVGQAGLRVFRPRAVLYVEISSADGNALPEYGLGLATVAPASLTRPRGSAVAAPAPAATKLIAPWARAWAAGRGY